MPSATQRDVLPVGRPAAVREAAQSPSWRARGGKPTGAEKAGHRGSFDTVSTSWLRRGYCGRWISHSRWRNSQSQEATASSYVIRPSPASTAWK